MQLTVSGGYELDSDELMCTVTCDTEAHFQFMIQPLRLRETSL